MTSENLTCNIHVMDIIFSLEDALSEYTVSRALRVLDVSRNTMMKWIKDNRFPNAFKSDGVTGEWRIPAKDVERVRLERIAELEGQLSEIQETLDIVRNSLVTFG